MTQLRSTLDELIRAALRAADPQEAIRRHVHRDGDVLFVDGKRYTLDRFDDVRLISVGKASVPMADEVAGLLGDRLSRSVIVTKYGHAGEKGREGEGETGSDPPFPPSPPPPFILVEAGHPIPDENSLRGGQAVCEALADCTERTLVITCVSGGASALLVAPHEGISLNTMRAINDALLRSGADIREMNAVRSRLDRLKGGGLVRMAQPAQVIGLILSDVIGDPLDVIASGLTNDARANNVLIGNNTQACQAVVDAARDLGFIPHIVTTELHGEARDAGVRIVHELFAPLSAHLPEREKGFCLIYGGETTVAIRGEGRGGRNQELALAAAIELNSLQTSAVSTETQMREQAVKTSEVLAVAALGTDGTDGPTDAAGAIAFTDTVQRAGQLGLHAEDFLARNDSYSFFQQLGDLITTGPTGTNVADVVIALVVDK